MSRSRAFRYILRYLIDPEFFPEERIEEVVEFCRFSRVEEVMLFVTAEELGCGHPTPDELDRYILLAKKLKAKLQQANVDLSLNPWSTTHHNMRGRQLKSGQNFRLMVGENGVRSTVTACPLCEEWQEYLCTSFAKLVREIRPTVLWVEDDWRLRNHDAALGWGGCFCEEHLARFSDLVHEPVHRTLLLEKVLQPGSVHPWRSIWLNLSRETMREPLRKLSRAIRAASPDTRVGLMSSNPDAHAAEGRNWHQLQEAVGDTRAFISRPNMGPYTQAHALQSAPNVARMTIANLEGNLEIYPELENSPRCGPYSKSRAFSKWQILNSAIIGSSGITINHYDMLGNGIGLDPQYGIGLREAKDVLNAIESLDLDDRRSGGVQVLFSPSISEYIQVPEGGKMEKLSQNSRVWGDTCSILGISWCFTQKPAINGAPILVSGQTLRAFSDEEILTLLAGKLWLDALSVEILLERGFGKQIGLISGTRRKLSETAYSYEEIQVPDLCPPEHANARMTAQRCSSWLLSLEPEEKAQVLSVIRRWDHHVLWPGSTYCENELGGRILSLSYPLDGGSQFFMGFFNVFRQEFLQRLLFREFSADGLACVSNPALHAYHHRVGESIFLAASNPLDDRQENLTWRLPGEFYRKHEWRYLKSDGMWQSIKPELISMGWCDELRFDLPVEALHAAFLLGFESGEGSGGES